MRRAAAALATAAALTAAAPAHAAVSRTRAAAIAVRAAGATNLASLVVQGPVKPLKRRAWIADAGPDAAGQRTVRVTKNDEATTLITTQRVPRLRRSAWLIWVDQAPYAHYEHPSTAVLVDVRSGRVVQKRPLAWWPLVNGRAPAFTQPKGYASKPYLLGARGLPTSPAPGAERSITINAPPAALAPGLDLSHECIVAMGDRDDPGFRPDFAAIHALGRQLGIRHVDAFGEQSLREQLTQLTSPLQPVPCNDVVLFLNGHGVAWTGAPPPDLPAEFHWGVPAITLHTTGIDTSSRSSSVRAINVVGHSPIFDEQQLEGVIGEFPRAAFKVLIDSCFAGAWQPPLSQVPNVVVVQTAAAATEPAKSWDRPTSQPPGSLPGAFTWGGTSGILTWATSPDAVRQTGPNLGKGILWGYGGSNIDAIEGVTHPPPAFDGTDLHGTYGFPPQEEVTGKVVPPPPKDGTVLVWLYGDFTADGRDWGLGSVDISPRGGHCSVGYTSLERCIGSAPFGETITIVAKPGDRSTFVGWKKPPCEGQGATCTFAANGDYETEAHFARTG